MTKPNTWSYKAIEIEEGLKPESKHFQYYYKASIGEGKKCHYCVWIDNDALSRFAKSKSFEEIASCYKDEWTQWVKKKIDEGDFRNRVLRFQKAGHQEIDLDELKEKLEPM